VEVGVRRDVKVVGVGDVVRALFARALVRGGSILIAVAWAHARPMAE
jgi:hypothetical protein